MKMSRKKFDEWRKSDATLHKFFSVAAKETPDRIALVDGEKSFTYRELDKLSDALAGYMQLKGLKKNQTVGIYLEKCHEYIVSCIAIIKAGASYLHIDLSYSRNIIEKILEDIAPEVILTKSQNFRRLPCNPRIILLDTDAKWASCEKFKKVRVDSSNVAFIGYSSGTTGIPKGIRVTHRAAVYSIAKFWQEIWHLPDIEEFGYSTYLSWDAMGPLMFGATAYIIADNVANSPRELLKYIKNKGINHTFFTPSLLKAVFDEVSAGEIKKCLANVNAIWLGGEVVTRELLKKAFDILPHVLWLNNYGPSECFVVSQGKLSEQDIMSKSSACPTGNILPEMKTVILDESMNEVIRECIGELYVSGPCLTDGYINNPELTKQKFVQINGTQYFRTGDLAYITFDNKLVIEGRADFIVKKETDLVNLLEIRDKILEILPISDCVILPLEKMEKLVCFFVKKTQESLQVNLNDLLESIPKNWIPDAFVEIEKVPINNVSQKINYSYLKILYEQTNK